MRRVVTRQAWWREHSVEEKRERWAWTQSYYRIHKTCMNTPIYPRTDLVIHCSIRMPYHSCIQSFILFIHTQSHSPSTHPSIKSHRHQCMCSSFHLSISLSIHYRRTHYKLCALGPRIKQWWWEPNPPSRCFSQSGHVSYRLIIS